VPPVPGLVPPVLLPPVAVPPRPPSPGVPPVAVPPVPPVGVPLPPPPHEDIPATTANVKAGRKRNLMCAELILPKAMPP
jgi:hypothetical protein